MSLTITEREIGLAITQQSFGISDAEALISRSLPLAKRFVDDALARCDMRRSGFVEFGSSDPETMKQVAKLFASDAMRGAFQKLLSAHFGCEVRAGFQLCCKIGIAVVGNAEAERRFAIFTSFESQVLAQRADLVDC